jgi:hypothetical protein
MQEGRQPERLKEFFLIGVIVLFGLASVGFLIGGFWTLFRS